MKKNILLSGIVALAFGVFTVACDDDDNYVINTDSIITSVTTGDAETTATTATVTGTVADLSSMTSGNFVVGAVYSTTENPVAAGTKVPGVLQEDGTTVVTTITGLQDGVTYYYATYVTLQGKVTEYGDVKSFVTTSSAVGTADASAVTASTATLGGTVNGVSDMLQAGTLVHGFKYAADASDVENGIDLPVETSTNSYTAVVDRLVPATTYYYAAYMMLNGNPVYGDVKSFTTTLGNLDATDPDADFVEMGTSVQWGKYNIGAEKEGELGGLYGYGDITGLNRSVAAADYASTDIASTDADIVAAIGAGFLPSPADFSELLAVSSVEDATVDGVKGLRFTSRLSGNSIFLPVAGSREGEEITGEGLSGLYMTGVISDNNNGYSLAYSLNGTAAKQELAPRGVGMSVRPVRRAIREAGIELNPYKVIKGDLEGNGNYRMEIFNHYGAGTYDNPPINIADVKAQICMSVTFSISGVGNDEYQAFLAFADGDWYPSNWVYNEDGNGSCLIKGDGEYTLRFFSEAPIEGAEVFCVDIVGLSAAVGAENVNAMIKSIRMDDFGTAVDFNPFKVISGNLEGNGNFRMELYNEYGSSKADPCVNISDISFGQYLKVDFDLEGVTVPGEYKAHFSMASAGWWPDCWSYNEDGNGSCIVTGDGKYSLVFKTPGQWDGMVVFCIDIEGLAEACGDGVKATVTEIRQL